MAFEQHGSSVNIYIYRYLFLWWPRGWYFSRFLWCCVTSFFWPPKIHGKIKNAGFKPYTNDMFMTPWALKMKDRRGFPWLGAAGFSYVGSHGCQGFPCQILGESVAMREDRSPDGWRFTVSDVWLEMVMFNMCLFDWKGWKNRKLGGRLVATSYY